MGDAVHHPTETQWSELRRAVKAIPRNSRTEAVCAILNCIVVELHCVWMSPLLALSFFFPPVSVFSLWEMDWAINRK